jgi:hypothetical protein
VKVILDIPPEDMALGLTAVLQTMAQQPDQRIGKEHGIPVNVGGNTYSVIRNLNSYTIR